MSNPTDNKLVEQLEAKSGMAIKRVCYFKAILRAIVRHYSYIESKDFGVVIQDAVDEVKGEKRLEHEESIGLNLWVKHCSERLHFSPIKIARTQTRRNWGFHVNSPNY